MAWTQRLLNVFRRTRVDDEIDDELRFHLDRRTHDNIAAGMPPDEARRDALRRLGNISLTKEQIRDVDTLRWLDELRRDLRYSLRTLRQNPGFTIVAVLSLALGIGANTAIFSTINELLVKDLSVVDPDQLVMFRSDDTAAGGEWSYASFSYNLFRSFRAQARGFSDVAAIGVFDRFNVSLGGPGGGLDPGSGVIAMVIGESGKLVIAGIVVGVPLALALTRYASARLYNVSAGDPLYVATAIVLMVSVALLASLHPAWQASRVDPMNALRSE